MQIEEIYKRTHVKKPFLIEKITEAIFKAMNSVNEGSESEAEKISEKVNNTLIERKKEIPYYVPNVEEIQDLVEQTLMQSEYLNVAKSYILYRNNQAKKKKRNVFTVELHSSHMNIPELYDYVDAIRHSYWIHSEFNFTSDIQDFKTHLTGVEKNAIKNAMLAISQIEVAVKSFWGDIYHRIPKPEIGSVGATFAESEVRHTDAYSHLLEILGLNTEFKNLKKNPVIMKRVRYLDGALASSRVKVIKTTLNQYYFSLYL